MTNRWRDRVLTPPDRREWPSLVRAAGPPAALYVYPHAIDLQLMQRTVRVETNEKKILDLGRQFFRAHQHGSRRTPQFLWRIVCESDPHLPSTAVTLSAFSDFGLRYVNIGQRSFLSVDLRVVRQWPFSPIGFWKTCQGSETGLHLTFSSA